MALLTYASPMEEQVIEKAIRESIPWDQLPKRVKLFVGTTENYTRAIRMYSMNARLRWEESPAANVCKESEYYDELVKHLRKLQSPFPYHLADYVSRVMRITPFKYYSEMLLDVMKIEKSYDTIPNFTAADALRETGIGRNQFIDIMNKSRAKLMWRLNRGIVRDLLPTEPIEFTLEPWWLVRVVNLTTDEYRKLSPEELSVVDGAGHHRESAVGEFDEQTVRALYAKGLVYFDVPVYPRDRFRVVSLEGFVSNRNEQHEDATEKLLYALFVTSSEQATVEEMAATLQADTMQLAAAISLACRLGWAQKVLDLESLFGMIEDGESFLENMSKTDEALSFADVASALRGDGGRLSVNTASSGTQGQGKGVDRLRVALMVDANLTSFLMMGSFSYELKQHAVTLFEAGKLGERAVSELCGELRVVERTQLEGELKKFTEHAFSLRCALSCLRTSSLASIQRSAAPQTLEASLSSEQADQGRTISESRVAGAADQALIELQELHRDQSSTPQGQPPPEASEHQGNTSNPAISEKEQSEMNQSSSGTRALTESSSADRVASDERDGVTGMKLGTFNRVEMLRCESLAGLPAATLQRLLQRDYNVIVSIVPLPNPLSIVSTHGGGPVHFGPPSPAFLTPWTKLLLYAICCAGPVSVVLMRGQRLRRLPPPLLGCSSALLWTWDGTSVGGAGAQIGGTQAPSSVLLNVLNNLLRHSAVLAQPISSSSASWDAASEAPAIDCVPLPIPSSRKLIMKSREATGSLAGIREQVESPQATSPTKPLSTRTQNKGGAGHSSLSKEASPSKAGAENGSSTLRIDELSSLVGKETRMAVQIPTDQSQEGIEEAPRVDPSSNEAASIPWESLNTASVKVVQDLGLHTVGFLRLIRVDAQGALPSGSGTESNSSGVQWVPHSIEFGIPMFDAQLCTKVCESIVDENMLSQEELEAQQVAAQLLRSTLKEFISDYREYGPLDKGVRAGDSNCIKNTSRKWSGVEDRPTHEVVTPHDVVVPSETRAASSGLFSALTVAMAAAKMRRQSAFLSRRLSTKTSEFWFHSDTSRNLNPWLRSTSLSMYGETADACAEDAANEEELLNSTVLPGVNLVFDGRLLLPLDISTYVQGYSCASGPR